MNNLIRQETEEILKAASELYHIPYDIVLGVFDIETLDYNEAEEIYGDRLPEIEKAADIMGLDWWKNAKKYLQEKGVDLMEEKKIQLSEADIQKLTMECVKRMLNENNFSSYTDRLRASYYMKAKKKGLVGDEAKAYADEKMGEYYAKQTAISDFAHDRDEEFHERETDPDKSEFYTGFSSKPGYLDSFGPDSDDPYVDDNDDMLYESIDSYPTVEELGTNIETLKRYFELLMNSGMVDNAMFQGLGEKINEVSQEYDAIMTNMMSMDESIDIDPKNKGKFTATKKRTGKSTEELTHSKNPVTRKRAIFAQNVKSWHHDK